MVKYLLCFLAVAMLFTACSSSDSPTDNAEITLLTNAQNSVDNALYNIWSDADTIAMKTVANNYDETMTRDLFDTFLEKHSQILEVVYVDSNGVIRYVEPPEYKSAEGADISEQPQVIQLFETNHRIMSDVFMLVEGYTAIVIESPLQKNNKCVGSISPVFKPNEFIKHFSDSIVAGKVDDFFVMQTNGDIVYDIDPTQSGRNLFTDTLYQDYPELLTAGHKIVEEDSGHTTYSFLDKTKQSVVNKDLWWRTTNFYGTKWKYCIVKEKK